MSNSLTINEVKSIPPFRGLGVLEVAILNVIPNLTAEFETAFAKAERIIASMKGYVSHQLQKCIEDPAKYILLVNWTDLEAHTVGFRGSAEYQEWKALLHHFYNPFPTVEHFEMVKGSKS
ncbi:antibiotic biosynthesis monooxygenase family protein [Pedobacter ureilyticus]|uniref:Antibiotic biosynthesis monooxygenase family protein n=1 Tax=Pedobacter ureilyticus TaxID=1393051 RepID=A0ABW9J2P7_9SPHI|nr:antibiotic biosynthesis monooxygenase [Pedobacter helvus]